MATAPVRASSILEGAFDVPPSPARLARACNAFTPNPATDTNAVKTAALVQDVKDYILNRVRQYEKNGDLAVKQKAFSDALAAASVAVVTDLDSTP